MAGVFRNILYMTTGFAAGPLLLVLLLRPRWRRIFAGKTTASLNAGLNNLVDYLSNSRDTRVINLLNQYPFRATPSRMAVIEDTTRKLTNLFNAPEDDATENQA